MTSLLYLTLSAFVLGALACWASSLLLYPLVRWISGSRVHFSSNFWFGMGMLPVIVGTALALVALGSGGLSSLQWMPDHCLEHGGHPHLCLSHIARSLPNGLLFWLVAAGAGVSIGLAGLRSYLANRDLLRELPAHSIDEGRFRSYPSEVPTAFTAGLLFPTPYLTTEAEKQLEPEEKVVVLAHEQEHARRWDPLRLFILEFCEKWIPGIRYTRSRWQIAAELECDQAALRAGYSKELVAATILKLQRATQGYLRSGSLLSYVGDDSNQSLKPRVEVLVYGQDDVTGATPLGLLLASLLFSGVVFFGEVHHVLETVLGWLS